MLVSLQLRMSTRVKARAAAVKQQMAKINFPEKNNRFF
jgi:hypothetical protein